MADPGRRWFEPFAGAHRPLVFPDRLNRPLHWPIWSDVDFIPVLGGLDLRCFRSIEWLISSEAFFSLAGASRFPLVTPPGAWALKPPLSGRTDKRKSAMPTTSTWRKSPLKRLIWGDDI